MTMGSNGSYDALLVLSFGGPEGMDDVMPFLERVTTGKHVPRERLAEVAEHYALFDGNSPANQQNRELVAALRAQFEDSGIDLPIYWGNRNWHPLLEETVTQMAADGVRRALAFVTSGYSSYSSCRQYVEDIARARAAAGESAPQIDKLRVFYNHPGFIDANACRLSDALRTLPYERRAEAAIVFTAHSIPQFMAARSPYATQLAETARLTAMRVGAESWSLAYQSRSGSAQQPWLGPDICDVIRKLAARGVRDVVLAPIGFVSDHIEVLYDLDVEARQVAASVGVEVVRAATAGTHPCYLLMVVDLVRERLTASKDRKAVGAFPAWPDACNLSCCASGEVGSGRSQT
jgi:ferrochelatase